MSTEKPGLVLPHEEYELVRRIVDRLHLQIEDAQEPVDWQARAEAAEAKLTAIRELCEEAGTLTGGRVLALIGSMEAPSDC